MLHLDRWWPEKVSFQIRKKENLENTPKYPSIEIWY